METRIEKRRRTAVVGAVVACALSMSAGRAASAATFAAQETHGGFVVERAGGPTGTLVANGWFRRPGAPTFVYREGGVVVAGIWESGNDAAVVRSGTTEKAPVIGRVVPSWNNNELRLTIEPAAGAVLRTGEFERAVGGGPAELDRGVSTREDLAGTYGATLHSTGGADVGWLNVDVDPEGATRFAGDVPATIPPSLAAAAAATVGGEVDSIYRSVVDVAPLRR